MGRAAWLSWTMACRLTPLCLGTLRIILWMPDLTRPNINAEGGLNEESYKRMYPTGAVSPKFYGLPKIHKPGIPLRPIISSTGTVTYNTARVGQNFETFSGDVQWSCPKHQGLCRTHKRCKAKTGRMQHLLWCNSTVYICEHSTCIKHHSTEISQRKGSIEKNQHDHQADNQPARILS